MFFLAAQMTLGYLYVRKQPLSWSNTLYGIWASYTLFVGSLGVVTILPLLKNRLHMRETTILFLALVSMSASCAMFAFSVNTWMAFGGR